MGTIIAEVDGGHGPSGLGAPIARGHDEFRASVTDPDPNGRILPELGWPGGVWMSSVGINGNIWLEGLLGVHNYSYVSRRPNGLEQSNGRYACERDPVVDLHRRSKNTVGILNIVGLVLLAWTKESLSLVRPKSGI